MFVWSVSLLCAFVTGTVSSGATASRIPWSPPETSIGTVSQNPIIILSNKDGFDLDAIPYSNGRGQVFETTDELIQSFRRQQPVSPELPAVVPSGQKFLERIPSKDNEAPDSNPIPNKDLAAPESSSTTSKPPPRPVFNRSLHLLDKLTVPGSDYTETYDIAWHAESNTALTEHGESIVYRMPLDNGQVEFLKVELSRLLNVKGICTKSPPLPATAADGRFPGLPDMEPFQFIGYKDEEGRQVENWQHVVISAPGEGGAVAGESLNFTHDFLLFRDGWDAVPLRYTVVTDSSILGPESDSYTHRYQLLPAPTGPIRPDLNECDEVKEYQADKRKRREKPPQKVDSGRFPRQ